METQTLRRGDAGAQDTGIGLAPQRMMFLTCDSTLIVGAVSCTVLARRTRLDELDSTNSMSFGGLALLS